MAEIVELECRNEQCPGRTEVHSSRCACEGSGLLPALAPPRETDEDGSYGLSIVATVVSRPCTEEPLDVDLETWEATWHRRPLGQRGGEWEGNHCPACSEEGTPVDGGGC